MPALVSVDGAVVTAVPAEFALYPYGVFTTCVAVDGTVLDWSAHLRRLSHDARALWGHDLDQRWVSRVVADHLSHLTAPATVRITLYPEALGIAAPAAARGCRALVSSDATAFPSASSAAFGVATVDYVREHPELKSTALLGQIRRRRDAQLAGHDDVLFTRGSEALEGATWTLLVWADGEVATPVGEVLASITAEQIGALATEWGWRFRRRAVGLSELPEADLVLAVNVNHPARAVTRIDGVPLPVDRELLTTLASAYAALPRQVVDPDG